MTDTLLAEIRSQPERWRALAASHDDIAALGARLRSSPPSLVRLAAHGTSDNAAKYATYVLRLLADWIAMRESISLSVYYGAGAARSGELAIALSQSGETPDVVRWLEGARAGGAVTAAVTNDPGSGLAAAGDAVLELRAGVEQSVAATKTYTCSLAVLALLGAYAASPERGASMARALAGAADAAEAALGALESEVTAVAAALTEVSRMYVVARGLEAATAAEIALKLTEVAYLGAQSMTATAMAHGPVAALDPTFPVWVVAGDDPTLAATREAVRRACEAGAPVIASGPGAADVGEATHKLLTPAAPDPLLTPLLSVLPGQLLARELALAKGLDPAVPRNLRKVTGAA